MKGTSQRSTVDVRGARAVMTRFLLPVEREQAGIINAFGRTLAEDIVTHTPVPSHDMALSDGYAVIAADTLGASRQTPKSLSVLSTSHPMGKQLESGTTMRIGAGEPLPEGADAVIAPASTFRPDRGPEVLVMTEAEPGDNVIPAGSTTQSGALLLKQGTPIGAIEMEVIASLGKQGIPVRRKPRVAVITSGTRVVDMLEEMKPGDIRNAPRYALVGMLLDAGCDLGRLIHVREGRLGLERALRECSECDAVILALSSEDKHDSALEALENSGVRCFDRVQIEPGSCCAFAIVSDRPVFVVDGRWILEAFEAVVRPALMMLLGREILDRPKTLATIGSTLKLNPGYSHLIRAITRIDGDKCITKPTSHSAETNSLILVGENVEIVKRGENVEVALLGR